MSKLKLSMLTTLPTLLFIGCASAAKPNPIILTNSQFETADRPSVPSADVIKYETCQIADGVTEQLLSKSSERALSIFMVGQEFVITDMKATLGEIKDVLRVQGVIISDEVPIIDRNKVLCLF